VKTSVQVVILSFFAAGMTGCSSLRDTSLDHRLPTIAPPVVDLGRYRSVQERDDGQDPDLAVAAAISGGGHRAANFAMGALLALEDFELDGRRYDLLREIDYFSTVSGGGFAAGTYISTLYDYLQSSGGKRAGYSLADALEANGNRLLINLERDYQGTIIEGFFCLQCLGYRDGGDIFERKLDSYVLGSKYRDKKRSLVFGDIFRSRESGLPATLPYWVPNATVYENGARFPFAPDVLEKYHVTGFTHGMRKGELTDDKFLMPVAVAIKASASFPVAFPATTLSCNNPDDRLNPYLHLMDGGLVDNMGYRTAIELLKQDAASRKILLIIDAYKGVSHPNSRTERSPAGPEAAYRIMKISLDTDHTGLKMKLDQLAAPTGKGEDTVPILVVFLGFDQLKPLVAARIEDIKTELAALREERNAATIRRMKREINTALRRSEDDLQEAEALYAMYHDARAVATSLNITRAEQRLLHNAGRAVVENNRAFIAEQMVEELKAD
jgi:hypothetical protein